MKVPLISFCFFAFFLILTCYSASAELYGGYANLSTTWTNNDSLTVNIFSQDNIIVRPILYGRKFGEQGFACGFLYNGTNMLSYQFAIFVAQIFSDFVYPQVVIWSANRDHEVGNGAILNFTATGDLVLQDVDGSIVWTTNTRGKSVAGMNLTDTGNLVLFDVSGSVVWQSFDYPTDCLVLGQRLYQGQQLVPSVSSTNSTAQKGLFNLQVTDDSLVAYVGSRPAQAYHSYPFIRNDTYKGRRYIRFLNGSLSFYIFSAEPDDSEFVIPIPQASPFQFIKLMPNGHLKLFDWQSDEFRVMHDFFSDNNGLGECGYPLACGRNCICSINQQCSCPVSTSHRENYYFRPVDNYNPDLGCSEITPVTCDSKQDQDFVTIENLMCFTYFTSYPDMDMVNMETCKEACLNNCSCASPTSPLILTWIW
ncbi:Apple-like protein [Artemisia annua]|uniref:Apple-like protein n=1 Tax=Artemisia annua TaxID=35608 RepID=A0A2U1MST8_ARTAN|nr:Apple-like protein [Artemisia annua]